jgi:hypothetical protein
MEDIVVGKQGLREGRMLDARSRDLDAGRKVTGDGEDIGRFAREAAYEAGCVGAFCSFKIAAICGYHV